MSKVADYTAGTQPIPDKYWLWPLYGAGIENLGRDGQPILVDTPKITADQILVRHDAVGLCFSDIKVINTGETHPRLQGRNMQTDPVVLGHEVAMTVVEVGANLADRFKVGDRFIIQADIIYKGVATAYGYALQGGLSQYNAIGRNILDGDEGCYLLPVHPDIGYAQAALTEPWACVTASYDVVYRAGWLAGGDVLIVAGPGAKCDYSLSTPYAGGQPPATVFTLGVEGKLAQELEQRAKEDGFKLVKLGTLSDETLAKAVASTKTGKGFDDLVFLGADSATYEKLEPYARKGAVLNLVGAQALTGTTQVDVGRVHYDNLSLTGTASCTIADAYKPIRTELKTGGYTVMIGAAGPMGQMHVQRVMEGNEGPRLVVATDLLPERLGVITEKFASMLRDKKGQTDLVLKTPEGKSSAEFNASLVEMTDGHGFDDIVVLAPSAGVVTGAIAMMADNAVMNIFAGLPVGTKAALDLAGVAEKGHRYTGTSGSAIRDLRGMLNLNESGRINPNLSVAAIGGLSDVVTGLDGVMHQAFTGKCVIYPMVREFPVTLLNDLKEKLPSVYAKLGPNESWTKEAEEEFLKEMLP
ncbi:MAG: alcohol dehydrogenase catalytic domain-containing protein [Chloroflexi bacterium]|nr:alcohol dehydrogenase catalytic domain-containing protein [Chloroflexota bacterium]